MPKAIYISPSMSIHRTFPNGYWNLDAALVQITSITNADGDLRTPMIQQVLERVAQQMTAMRILNEEHQQEKRSRRINSSGDTSAQTNDNNLLDDIFDGVAAVAEEFSSEVETTSSPPLRAKDLSFTLVNENATVRTRLFPRTFHCKKCGHFVALNVEQLPASLQCPCCLAWQLRQEPIVFGCARCAIVRELIPKGQFVNENSAKGMRKSRTLKSFLGGAPVCHDCTKGHIHLQKHNVNTIHHWEWRCTVCTYQEPVEEFCLNCALPSTGELPSSRITMNPFPAAASGALAALSDVQMFVGGNRLSATALYAVAQQAGQDWGDYFDLSQARYDPLRFSLQDNQQFTDACIDNIYVLKRLSVVTTTYGYRAGNVMNNGMTPVAETDRLVNFFADPEQMVQHMCYGTITQGAALIFAFDQQALVNRLAQANPSYHGQTYSQVVKHEQAILATTLLQDILDANNVSLQLFPALHALEHALLTSAQRLIGNETLQSLLFFEEGKLILYERDAIGRGGVIQIVNRGPGLLALLDAATDHVTGCAQGCRDGCPSCIYVRDESCHYQYEDLGRNWLPWNALLSRTGARLILSPTF